MERKFTITNDIVYNGHFPKEAIEKVGIEVDIKKEGWTKEIVTLTLNEEMSDEEFFATIYSIGTLVSTLRKT